MPQYRRAYVRGGTYFFTVTLRNRRSGVLVEHIDHLRTAFRAVRWRHPFAIDAMVVLPDHLHCLWTLPESDADFSTRWRLIKARFARDVGHEVWQQRFWEHLIRDERDRSTHADYIHFNPVKHGHVARVSDWPYSSFHRFVEAGVYSKDWAAPRDVEALDRD